MDTRLDQNKTELGVLVTTVALQVLAHGDRLLDKHVKVLGDLGGETCKKNAGEEDKRGQAQACRM